MEEAKSLHQQRLQIQSQQQEIESQSEQISVFQHKQQQQQSAISRFPSNIDAHLGLRTIPQHNLPSNNNNNPNPGVNMNMNMNMNIQQQQQQQQQQKKGRVNNGEVQMAYQDAWRVCHPDFHKPFLSLEDACERLLPYHVVADYEAEEDDRILESDPTGQVPSRSQQWDNNIATKVAEFTATFEKQALAFNIISRKRAVGEFRSEERLMIEQALLQEEKQALSEFKAEMHARENASRESHLRMAVALAQAQQTSGDPQVARGPLRGSAVGSQRNDHDMREREHVAHNPEEMMNGWGNNVHRDEREPSEDFLNDEETDNGETSGQHEWREVGEFDLNTR